MALIIKGDMPSKGCLNCFGCQYLNLSETSYFNNRQSYRVGCVLAKFLGLSVVVKNTDELHNKPSDCPIIGEIPDKHGDMIDSMALIHHIEENFDSDEAQDIIGEILASPTVVEATE